MIDIEKQIDELCESKDSNGDYIIEFIERNPHIYAFRTKKVPDYLKIGYTDRPVSVRLKEWGQKYEEIEPVGEWLAKVKSEKISEEELGVYFMDHAVHEFIKRKGPHYVGDIEDPHPPYNNETWKRDHSELYFSEEFFKNAKKKDVEGAIKKINDSYPYNYTYYTAQKKIQVEKDYERGAVYEIRGTQQEVINNFKRVFCEPKNKEDKHKNLLMYAVMRFGKTFTALCCARAMKARVVVVVSAKADVRTSWKENVQKPAQFGDYNGQYEFVFVDDSKKNKYSFRKFTENGLSLQKLLNGEATEDRKLKNVVIFLTLQNLQKEKERLNELRDLNIDLLIVDETHYGARGDRYGQVIGLSKASKMPEEKEVEKLRKDEQKLSNEINNLKFEFQCMLHLSGTPYHILADRESKEFKDDNDIIGFFQYSDIMKEQKKWDEENLNSKDPKPEWKNPYYGFPQMIRFAFNPGAECRKYLNNSDAKFSLSELFAPCSIEKDSEKEYQKFKHRNEVLYFMKVLDGKKSDDEILSFLDYQKIKDCKLCQHIVMVLPYKSSCDAMEQMINQISDQDGWNHWQEYEVLNVAGWNTKYKTVEDVQKHISKIEEIRLQEENRLQEDSKIKKKSITLTVNHMLTGVTVEEWDTMIFLKNSSSAQEYDQAIYRLQNTYVRDLKDNNGKMIGKINMKPQTLLVDFDPTRMFCMQMERSMMGALMKKSDNVEQALKEDMKFSPIIVLNANKVSIVQPTDIVAAVRRYVADRNIIDEALSIPTDSVIFNNAALKDALQDTIAIDNKKGLILKPYEGEGTDFQIPNNSELGTTTTSRSKGSNKKDAVNNDESEIDELKKKLATHIAFLLLYVFLSDTNIENIADLSKSIEDSCKNSVDNKRIFKHLNLDKRILRLLSSVDQNTGAYLYFNQAISDINAQKCEIAQLKKDQKVAEMEEKLAVALKKFNRMGNDEVVTPAKVAKLLFEKTLKQKHVNAKTKFLDVASKQGEFSIALLKFYQNKVCKENIYAIATSSIGYELTRKVFSLFDINTDQIFEECYTCKKGSTAIKKFEFNKDMKFDIVVGNPPYSGKGDPMYMQIASVIYNNNLKDDGVLSLIHPTALVENKYQENESYKKLKQKYERCKILDFYYDPQLRDMFGAAIGNGIGIFCYSKSGKYNLFHDELKKKRFLDFEKDKKIIDTLVGKEKIGNYAKHRFIGYHGSKDELRDKANKNSLDNHCYVVMAYNRGHINTDNAGHMWDWTTLQSEDYLAVQDRLPDIALNAVEFSNREEAIRFIKWTTTDFMSFIILYYKYFMTNNPALFDYLPAPPASGDFSDSTICKAFNLTLDDMKHIHEKVKNFGWKKYFKTDEAGVFSKIDEKNK